MNPGPLAAKSPARKPTQQRILLVDDHPMMREGMGRMIDLEPDMRCCGGVNSAEEAISLLQTLKPDLLITDITLPGRNGLELIREARALDPEMPILVFSMHDELFFAERALKAGARGYLMKEAGSERMIQAIRRILAGEIAVSAAIAAKILDQFAGPSNRFFHSPIEKLTDREFEVYQLIGEGKSTKEIAGQLHLSEKTVAVHRGHIKEKLGLDSALNLVRHALRWTESRNSGQRNAAL